MRRHVARWLIIASLSGCGGEVIILGGGTGGAGHGSGATSSAGGSTASTGTPVTTATTTAATGGAGAVGAGGAGASAPTAGGGGSGSESLCPDGVVTAELRKRQADIIFVIDNHSQLMESVAAAVEQNLHASFAAVLAGNDIDHRIIMLADHGPTDDEICIGPPLSGTLDCTGSPVNVPDQFYHWPANIGTRNSLCHIWGALNYGTAQFPEGMDTWLRPAAHKFFVQMSPHGVDCKWGYTILNDDIFADAEAEAIEFDYQHLIMDPAQFGTTTNRKYELASIVGLAPKPNPADPYLPSEPVTASECPDAYEPGALYQWLSTITGGLRFPICAYAHLDAMFLELAADIIAKTGMPCTFALPEAPMGETLDLSNVSLLYQPDAGSPESWTQVASSAACSADAFYVDGGEVVLCPQACATIAAVPAATLTITVPCN